MLLDLPRVLLVVCLLLLFVADRVGIFLKQRSKLTEDERDDYKLVVGATLTLLSLIIGFTFSMAVSRYDLRKHYEAEEANAIGTEYARAGLLPPADAAKVRGLLRSYLDHRVLFYKTTDARLQQINAKILQLQDQLWSAVQAVAVVQPTPVNALTASGMNDVLNSQGYAQAAEWNRIPVAAWGLMIAIAICANLLVGYGRFRVDTHALLRLILPLMVAVSFFLISDIDSPRSGVIRVLPQNLESLAQSLPR